MSLIERLATTGKRFHCVCFTIRSGSTLLRDDLAQLHLGAAHEYFQAPLYEAGEERADDFVARTVDESPGQHFGFKISWYDAHLLPAVLRNQGDPDATADLRTIFPGLKHIHVVRNDKIGQAISAWRAASSGTWHVSTDTTADRGHPQYDYEAILGQLQVILTEDLLWARHFSAGQIPHLRVEYESYVEDRAGTLRKVAAFLGVRRLRIKVVERTQVMRDGWTQEIVERFWADLRAPELPIRLG